jgi:glutamate-5-semialdehyde dehydrogenase
MSSSSSAISPAEVVAKAAKKAYDASQLLDASERTVALVALKLALTQAKDEILAANALDIAVRYSNLSGSLDRN